MAKVTLTIDGKTIKAEKALVATGRRPNTADLGLDTVGLTADLLKEFEAKIESIRLVPSEGGRFEVSVDGKLIYSKLATGRHAEPGEVVAIFRKQYGGS